MGAIQLQEILARRHVYRGVHRSRPPPCWGLGELFGRLVEISGEGAGAALTVVIGLVLEAQRCGEPVIWVASEGSTFYPPDVAHSGVDLTALPVVRVRGVEGRRVVFRCADRLLRSGAFGLVVLDLGDTAEMPLSAQTRLAGLAKKHDTALVCITRKSEESPSLGSMITLRALATRRQVGEGRYRCQVRVLKDKRRGPGWGQAEEYRGPPGLR